jgi:hypothetical protein
MNPGEVFISYSHADARSLTRLRVHLRPFERLGKISAWSDQNIKPGQKWREEIERALSQCKVAILLISADFLASDFIVNNELPPLLKAAQDRGLIVLPVVLRPCAFEDVPDLSSFQSCTDPAKPLLNLSENEQESIWVDVARRVRDALSATHNPSSSHATEETQDAPPEWVDTAYGMDPPEAIKDYRVYQYQHIDVLGFMRRAEDILRDDERKDDYLAAIQQRFLDAGWEGDGVLQAMWFPPFVGAGIEDTYGVPAWHVKQSNNGTSFIASPVDLPFSRLREQQY